MTSEYTLMINNRNHTNDLHREAAAERLAKQANKTERKGLNLGATLDNLLAQVWQPTWTTATPAARPATTARLATTTGEIFPVKF
jgi:hypothetical protein